MHAKLSLCQVFVKFWAIYAIYAFLWCFCYLQITDYKSFAGVVAVHGFAPITAHLFNALTAQVFVAPRYMAASQASTSGDCCFLDTQYYGIDRAVVPSASACYGTQLTPVCQV